MTFSAKETSAILGEPFELYLFTFGSKSGSKIGFTNSTEEKTHVGVTFKPTKAIDRGRIVVKQSLDKSQLQVTVARDHPLVDLYKQQAPSYVVTLIIYQGHHNDPDDERPVIWTGRVLGVEWEDSEATLLCEPVSTSMRRVGLRYNYQLPCQHVLYGPLCGASLLAGTVTDNVAEIGTSTIRMPPGWYGAKNPAKFVYGYIAYDTADNTEYRTILEVENDETLHLAAPPTGLNVGDEVNVILGCNHHLDDCLFVHDRIESYGGMPLIPSKNPIHKNNFND